MNKKVRLFLSLLLLLISLSMLVWAYAPNPRETRIQSIQPSEMELP